MMLSCMNWALSIVKLALLVMARHFQAQPNISFLYNFVHKLQCLTVAGSKMSPHGIMYGGGGVISAFSPTLAAPLASPLPIPNPPLPAAWSVSSHALRLQFGFAKKEVC